MLCFLQSELYWSSLAEREPASIGGATGHAAWRAWRTRALASQLPKQDLSLDHCRHIDQIHHKQYEDFVAARNEIALDIGLAGQHHGASIECTGCTKSIRNGSVTVQAPRIGEDAYYHPSCFSCAECDELLVELAYCALDGRLYCVRHYAERLKPRCHACDEVRVYYCVTDSHECDELLVELAYCALDGRLYCVRHYAERLKPRCHACDEVRIVICDT
ncbi:Uncharacterized protein OBRU01_08919 [Operophtera brumata]|uniref:LIM zinc-binding domain-containing protein n=1 Tax=Operophtera brumata TaxID=104452 RepID=A0A0L7L9M7_OPEBR|nr:Uncharacterized protein OBRU01_08919 [Operophtera brumata]